LVDDRFKVSRDTVLSRLMKYREVKCDHLMTINAAFFDQVSALCYVH